MIVARNIESRGNNSMKKIINDPLDVEQEMIDGFILADSKRLKKLGDQNIIIRQKLNPNKVALITGGGSGHEPAHIGYIGFGMLDAVIVGSIFTSPPPKMIFDAINAVKTDKGVLCIVKNYSGDVMSFEMAIEMARNEGIKVDKVVVEDDIVNQNSEIGGRGVAGTVLVHKIAGAMAETGADLKSVKEIAERTINNVRTMGMAVSPCIIPASGLPSFELANSEIEIGIGIHGEPGIQREKFTTANEISKKMLDKILACLNYSKNEVVLMINGLGSTPLMELFIINKFVQNYLQKNDVEVYDTMIGNFMTSIEMAGFSLTLLKLDEELKKYYNSTADTFALKK